MSNLLTSKLAGLMAMLLLTSAALAQTSPPPY